MRIHCIGVGSIGSLVATHLAHIPNTQVRLVLRRKELASALFSSPTTLPSALSKGSGAPLLSLRIEKDGIARRTDGFEVELTPSPEDRAASGRSEVVTDKFGTSGKSKKHGDLVRNDPISSLFITTKATSTLFAVKSVLPRLSRASTVVICQNGMGALEGLLDTYWPDDYSTRSENSSESSYGGGGGRPSFICATISHGVWRKGFGHHVHAGKGDLKFGIVPNQAALASIASTPSPSWGDPFNNPILNSRSLVFPTLEHLPLTPETESLHNTLAVLLQTDLSPSWLPLPTFQIAQLQKLAVNASVNSLTALMGVNNGSLIGSEFAKSIIRSVCHECTNVFAAHLAREEGRWTPPPSSLQTSTSYPISRSDPSPTYPSMSSRTPSPIYPPAPPLPQTHPLSEASLLNHTFTVLLKTSINLSSTLQDIRNTQPSPPTSISKTEVEFINGYLINMGNRYGVRTDSIENLGKLVRLKEEMVRSGAVDTLLEVRSAALGEERGRREKQVFENSNERTRTGAGRRSTQDSNKGKQHAREKQFTELKRVRTEQRSKAEREKVLG